MSVDKKIDYVEQDGYNNYIKNSDSVTVPRKFKSRENATPTKLAYITDAEAKQLKKQNKGTPHKGPSGIPSYDDFDAQGNFTSGAAMSAMESGSTNARDRAEVKASNYGAPSGAGPGVKTQAEQDLRSSIIAAGAGQRVNPGFFDSRNVISPYELNLAKLYAKRPDTPFAKQAMRNTRGGGLGQFLSSGGIFGNLLRGLGQTFGLGKKYNEPTYDMSRLSGLPYGGSAAFENLDIRDKFNRTVEDIDTVDKEVKEKYNNYLLDAPPNPLTFEQFKGALENISMPDTAALPNEGILQVAEVLPNTVRQLKNLGIFKQGQKSTYTDKDELRMLVPSLNNATDEELDQIIAGTFKV